MRIIDKKTDFYDYLQNVYADNSLIFDRMNSFVLSKEAFCKKLTIRNLIRHGYKGRYYNFCLLQVCHTFWLFLIEITEINNFGNPSDYNIQLITTWKNYNKLRKLISLEVIDFDWPIRGQIDKNNRYFFSGYDEEKIYKKSDILIHAINNNNYRIENNLTYATQYKNHKNAIIKENKDIPLLKACGIANCINALDIFLAFEEYFSLEKSSSERREPIGITNNDKIERHGFDTKTSFRRK